MIVISITIAIDINNSSNSSNCINNDILPSSYRVNGNDVNGHIHLVLLVSDYQIPTLLNFIAVTISLKYLPSHRLMFHFICNGGRVTYYIEKVLHHDCIKIEHSITYKHEYHKIIHKLIDTMEENNDYATIVYDLDTIWIRNMIALYDYLGTKSNIMNDNGYDIIAVGQNNNHYNKYVTFSYSGIFFKNSKSIKELSKLVVKNLESGLYDGKDMLSEILFSNNNKFCTNITQVPISTSSGMSLLQQGSHGNFKCINDITGSYMNLPLSYTPHNDNEICSKSAILFYRRKLEKCNDFDYLSMNCSDANSPEWIIKDHFVHKAIPSVAAPHKHRVSSIDNTFDSNLQKYLVSIIQTYVDKEKLLKFCETYTMICKRKITVEKAHDLPLDTIESLD
jgi:hypothetical protein